MFVHSARAWQQGRQEVRSQLRSFIVPNPAHSISGALCILLLTGSADEGRGGGAYLRDLWSVLSAHFSRTRESSQRERRLCNRLVLVS